MLILRKKMRKRKNILLWLGLIISIPVATYAGVRAIFYAWLSAANPESWSPERAGLYSGSAFALAIVFFILFIYCLVTLIKDSNKKYRNEENVKKAQKALISGNGKEAEKFFLKAANAGSAHAAHELGVLYMTGAPDVIPNKIESQKWFTMSLQAGFEASIASDPEWFKSQQ